MRILSIKMKYADKKWPDYLKEVFGEATAEKFVIESHATASTHEAKIELHNFSGNSKIINIIKSNENVLSAYIIEDNTVKTIIV